MAIVLALRIAGRLAGWLPRRWVTEVAGAIGRLAGYLATTRSLAQRNLSAIVAAGGSPKVTVGDLFAAYGRYWGEFFSLASRSEEGLARWPLTVRGAEHLERAREQGPVCLLSAHYGNWDLALAWLGPQLSGLTVVTEALQPPALFDFFARARRRWAGEVLAADGSGLRLWRRLRAGGHLALIVDRVIAAADGEETSGARSLPFLGGWRRFPSAGVELARRAGATLLPVFLTRQGAHYELQIHPPLAPGGDPLRDFARLLERTVRRDPSQWCLLYPLYDATAPAIPNTPETPREDALRS